LFFLLGSLIALISQGYSYVDEAGNIHFVERLDQIPTRYRYQVVKPSPTLDPTQYYKVLKQKRKKATPRKPTKTPTPKATKPKKPTGVRMHIDSLFGAKFLTLV
jgi:hypothetical protein